MKLRDLLYGLFLLACVLAMIWPGYALLGNRVTPYILGVPFSLVWVIAWVLLSFVALWLYDYLRNSGAR